MPPVPKSIHKSYASRKPLGPTAKEKHRLLELARDDKILIVVRVGHLNLDDRLALYRATKETPQWFYVEHVAGERANSVRTFVRKVDIFAYVPDVENFKCLHAVYKKMISDCKSGRQVSMQRELEIRTAAFETMRENHVLVEKSASIGDCRQ